MINQQSSSSATRFPAWQRAINAALNEADPQKLLEHIHSAETAIYNRLQELADNPNKYPKDPGKGPSPGKEAHIEPYDERERQAIAQALETLRCLKRDKLGFPDWNESDWNGKA
jgi:hypothetical protein